MKKFLVLLLFSSTAFADGLPVYAWTPEMQRIDQLQCEVGGVHLVKDAPGLWHVRCGSSHAKKPGKIVRTFNEEDFALRLETLTVKTFGQTGGVTAARVNIDGSPMCKTNEIAVQEQDGGPWKCQPTVTTAMTTCKTSVCGCPTVYRCKHGHSFSLDSCNNPVTLSDGEGEKVAVCMRCLMDLVRKQGIELKPVAEGK